MTVRSTSCLPLSDGHLTNVNTHDPNAHGDGRAPRRPQPATRLDLNGDGTATGVPALHVGGTPGDGHDAGPVLVTGGAGFVGTNVAARLAGTGRRVRVFDNLARTRVEDNLRWLTETYPDCIDVVTADASATAAATAAATVAAVARRRGRGARRRRRRGRRASDCTITPRRSVTCGTRRSMSWTWRR